MCCGPLADSLRDIDDDEEHHESAWEKTEWGAQYMLRIKEYKMW